MIAGADVVVDAEARRHHAFAALEPVGVLGAHAALARKLAFAVGDDDFQPLLGVRIASFRVAAILATL